MSVATLWWDLARIRGSASLDWVLALALAAMGIGVDLYKLGSVSLWGDEAFSVGLVSNSWSEMWRYVWTTEANMALYHVVLKAWLGVTGLLGIPPVELVVRLPSVICAGLAVFVVFWTGRRFWSVTVGAIGATLLMLNQVELLMAREARSYSLQVLLICFGWYALLVAMSASRHRRRWWIAYAMAMALAVYAHLFSALVVAAQVAGFGALLLLHTDWRMRARHSLRAMALSVAAISVAIMPLVVFAALHGSSNLHVGPASLLEAAKALWNISGHSLVYGLLLAVAASAAVLLAVRAQRRSARESRALRGGATAALVCWLIVPFALAYVASQPGLNLHLFAWGYLVVVVPALCLLAGVGVASLRTPVARGGLALGLLAAAALAMPPGIFGPAQDFRSASAWIRERYSVGDGLVCTSWSCALAADYYARIDEVPTALLDGAPAVWSWSGGGARPLDPAALQSYAAARSRIFLVGALLDGDAPEVKSGARGAEQWLDSRYQLIDDVAVPSTLGAVRVRLYVLR